MIVDNLNRNIKLRFYPKLIQSIVYQSISGNLKLIQNGIDTERGQPKWLPSHINC